MDLDEAADQLYAATPEEFVALRTALVKQARSAKDRELAGAVGALRKPTRTAWLVNLLARSAADDVTALLDLGPALREAQADQDGAALRRLSSDRRTAIDGLVRRATALAREHGHPATESTTAEVAATLQAALGDASVAQQVRLGRLATGAVYGGFGQPDAPEPDDSGDLMAALAASMPTTKKPPEDEVGKRRRAALAQARAEARAARDKAVADRDEAERAADAATERADSLAEDVERLRAELATAESAEQTAREDARAARDTLRVRRDQADAAESAWADAAGSD